MPEQGKALYWKSTVLTTEKRNKRKKEKKKKTVKDDDEELAIHSWNNCACTTNTDERLALRKLLLNLF